jgi:uncharacterized membrane protein YbhN (UPF0104 family)
MRRAVFIVISVLVSGIVLALAVRDVPLAEVGRNLSNIDVGWAAVTMLMIFLGLWARAVRWRGLLDWRMSLIRTFHASNIMFMLNFLPLRLGEVARTALAARYGVPFVTAATSVLVERLIDTFFVVLVLSFALARLPESPPGAVQAATIFGIGAFIGFVVLVMLARFPTFVERILDLLESRLRFLSRLPLRTALHDALVGLQPLTHWRSAAHLIVWTLIAWAFSFSGYYCAQRALGVHNIDMVLNSFLSVALIAFSIAIPVTLMSIGPFQAAARLGGTALGLNPEAALALGVLYHVMTFIGYGFLGVLGFIALGVSFGDVTQRVEPLPEP